MQVPFNCLMFTGKPLTEDLRNYLYRLACAMMRDRNQRKTIKHDAAIGTVRNENQSARLGSYSGETFFAEMETKHGKTTVRYLVSTRNHRKYADELPRGTWISRTEIISDSDPSDN